MIDELMDRRKFVKIVIGSGITTTAGCLNMPQDDESPTVESHNVEDEDTETQIETLLKYYRDATAEKQTGLEMFEEAESLYVSENYADSAPHYVDAFNTFEHAEKLYAESYDIATVLDDENIEEICGVAGAFADRYYNAAVIGEMAAVNASDGNMDDASEMRDEMEIHLDGVHDLPVRSPSELEDALNELENTSNES